MTRPIIAGIAAVALGVAAVLATAGAASAHDVLVDSTPRDGEVVTELPAAFSITMNEPLTGSLGGTNGFAIQVTDAAGKFYGDGCLVLQDATMSMGATLGEPGDYVLVWQIISADGHPTAGELAFTWDPAPDALRTEGAASPPVCGEDAEEPSATPTPGPTRVDSAGPSHHEDSETPDLPLATVLWIGGGVLLAAIVITIVLLVVRRRNNTAG